VTARVAALLFLAAACTNDVTVGEPLRRVLDVPPDATNMLDVLFVIDRSADATAQRAALVAGINDGLFDELASRFGNVLPDVHVAVISSEVAVPDGSGGSLPAGCDIADTGRMTSCTGIQSHWLDDAPNSDPEAPRIGNHPGIAFPDAVACLADLPPSSCAVSQPIAAVQGALGAGAPAPNAGFLRDGALLLVVFLAPRDDCSARAPSFYQNGEVPTPVLDGRCFAASTTCAGGDCAVSNGGGLISIADATKALELKTDKTQVMVAGVFAPPGPVSLVDRGGGDFVPSSACAGVDAAPGFRLAAVAGAFSSRYSFASLCDQDPAGELRRIGSQVADLMQRSDCVIGPVPPHATCRAFTAVDLQGPHTPVPACGDGIGGECFTLQPSDACADTESGLAATLTGASPSDAHFVVECAAPDGL
jgi:hypothetical protein